MFPAKEVFIEQARNKELARDLARLQQKVVEKLIRFADKSPERFEDMGGYRDSEMLWFYTDCTFQGIDEVSIGVIHSFNGAPEHFRRLESILPQW